MVPWKLFGTTLAVGVVAFSAASASAQEFSARLDGFQELGALNGQTGAVLSNGSGTLTLNLNENAKTASWTLKYSDVGTTLPQTGMVSQAHIHFGKSRDSGGVMVFFCSNLGTGPAGTQTCPANTGTVTGSFTPASVVAIGGQNVKAGDFNALVEALTSDTAYANIHTVPLQGATNTAFPAGEIRGQIHRGELDQNTDRGDNHDHR